MAFMSKYAVSLYENVAQLVNLDRKFTHVYTLDEFRDLLGVQPGRYKTFGELNKHVIKPAVDEINALASFSMNVLPVKQGKRVAEIRIGWWQKDASALRAAWEETQRTRVGRRARISGTVESVAAPLPSVSRMMRDERKAHGTPKTS
jgi:plasmid replication initiation protein